MPPIITALPSFPASPDTEVSDKALLALLRETAGTGVVTGEPVDATPDERFRVRTLMALARLPEATRRFSRLGAKHPALAGGAGFAKTFAVVVVSVIGFPLLMPSVIAVIAGLFVMCFYLFASIRFGKGSTEDVEMRAAMRRMRWQSISDELRNLIRSLNMRISAPIPILLVNFAECLSGEARMRGKDEPDLKTDVRLASVLSGGDLFALMRLRDRLRAALKVAGTETVIDALDGETQELLHRAIEATGYVKPPPPPKQLSI